MCLLSREEKVSSRKCKVLERVDEYNAQRMKLTAEMVDASATDVWFLRFLQLR